jgi:hypothetical protein
MNVVDKQRLIDKIERNRIRRSASAWWEVDYSDPKKWAEEVYHRVLTERAKADARIRSIENL